MTTKGTISVSGLVIQSNGGGATLANNQIGSTGGVTVKTSQFTENSWVSPDAGLVIETNGAVLLDQVTASNNYNGYGARVSSVVQQPRSPSPRVFFIKMVMMG